MKNGTFLLFLKENTINKYKTIHPMVVFLGILLSPLLLFYLYKGTRMVPMEYIYFLIFAQFFLIFFISFVFEIYYNRANRMLLTIPAGENKILYQIVISKTMDTFLLFFCVDVYVMIKLNDPLFHLMVFIILVLSTFALSYTLAFFLNNMVFITAFFLFLILAVKYINTTLQDIPRVLLIILVMAPLVSLFLLKFSLKLKQPNGYFFKYYMMVIKFIKKATFGISRLLPFSPSTKTLVAKDLYYLFSNSITLITIFVNFLLIVFLIPVKGNHHFFTHSLLIIAFLFNALLYFEKCISIFSGIEKNGTILLKIFPVTFKKIFVIKFFIITLFFDITGMVNLFFVFRFFNQTIPSLFFFLKYALILTINGFFFTVISFFMFRMSTHQPDMDNFSFGSMLFEQAPVMGKEFLGIIPGFLIIAMTSFFLYFFF